MQGSIASSCASSMQQRGWLLAARHISWICWYEHSRHASAGQGASVSFFVCVCAFIALWLCVCVFLCSYCRRPGSAQLCATMAKRILSFCTGHAECAYVAVCAGCFSILRSLSLHVAGGTFAALEHTVCMQSACIILHLCLHLKRTSRRLHCGLVACGAVQLVSLACAGQKGPEGCRTAGQMLCA